MQVMCLMAISKGRLLRPPYRDNSFIEKLGRNVGVLESGSALAGVTQWIECQPVNQRVSGLIPSPGHVPGLWVRSPVGGARQATTHGRFSPSFSLPSPF